MAGALGVGALSYGFSKFKQMEISRIYSLTSWQVCLHLVQNQKLPAISYHHSSFVTVATHQTLLLRSLDREVCVFKI